VGDPRSKAQGSSRAKVSQTFSSVITIIVLFKMDLNSIFTQIRDKLDAHYDRRERLVKISRDITALSKKMIFSLQRIQGDVKVLPPGIQKEVDQREGEIQKLLEKAEPDVQGANAYR
jgi:Translin family